MNLASIILHEIATITTMLPLWCVYVFGGGGGGGGDKLICYKVMLSYLKCGDFINCHMIGGGRGSIAAASRP